jgi:hypothetical protein
MASKGFCKCNEKELQKGNGKSHGQGKRIKINHFSYGLLSKFAGGSDGALQTFGKLSINRQLLWSLLNDLMLVFHSGGVSCL